MTSENALHVPASTEAEEAILGSLLMNPEMLTKVAGMLKPQDFFIDRNRWIYEAILKLREEDHIPDIIVVVDELERRGVLEECGGRGYLTSLVQQVPSAFHIEHYGNIVRRTSVLRQLIDAAGDITKLAYQDQLPLSELLDRAEQSIFAVSQGHVRRELAHIKQVVTDVTEEIERRAQQEEGIRGVSTGLAVLDGQLGGFQKSDLIILAARPAMGKTSMALHFARQAANTNPVAVFSLEMSAEQLAMRLLAAESGISAHSLNLGRVPEDKWGDLIDAASVLTNLDIYIDDTPAASVMQIRTKARRLQSEVQLGLIVIDYLQLMQGEGRGRGGENRVQEISYISRSLKALARELEVPVIALSQLSRGVEHRQDRHPILSDLRESGSIEQDADIVMFLYRDDYYTKENSQKPGITEVEVAKHRNGPTGKVEVFFDGRLTRFSDLVKRERILNDGLENP